MPIEGLTWDDVLGPQVPQKRRRRRPLLRKKIHNPSVLCRAIRAPSRPWTRPAVRREPATAPGDDAEDAGSVVRTLSDVPPVGRHPPAFVRTALPCRPDERQSLATLVHSPRSSVPEAWSLA